MAQSVATLWALTRFVVLEIVRQPFCLLLTLGSVTFIALLPLLLSHTLGHGEKLVRDSALAVQLGSGMVLGGSAACAILREETRLGATAAILSKPVGRGGYVLATFSGIGLVLLATAAAETLATLLSVRTVRDPFVLDLWSGLGLPAALVGAMLAAGLLNYLVRTPFASTGYWTSLGAVAAAFLVINLVGPDGCPADFGARLDPALVPVSMLVFLALLMFAALSVWLAAFLDTVAALSVCTVILALGLMSDYLFGRAAASSLPAAIAYGLLPNWQHFWAADALTNREPITARYLAGAASYALSYSAALLCLAVAVFRHRDVRA